MTLFGEMYQQNQIADNSSETLKAASSARQAVDRVSQLEQKVDTLALTCQAMWELLRDHSALTENHIEEKVMEIDLRDGKADGKMGSTGHKCPSCQRTLSLRHVKCMYCGLQVKKEHVFQS